MIIVVIYIVIGIILSFNFYKIDKRDKEQSYYGYHKYETNGLQVAAWIIAWPIFLLESIKIK